MDSSIAVGGSGSGSSDGGSSGNVGADSISEEQ